jgi:hypothetical protein
VARWRRTARLLRGKAVEVIEDYQLTGAGGSAALHLLTPCEVRDERPGVLHLTAQGAPGVFELTYDPGALSPAIEEVPIEDPELRAAWGGGLRRITLSGGALPAAGSLRVTLRRR